MAQELTRTRVMQTPTMPNITPRRAWGCVWALIHHED